MSRKNVYFDNMYVSRRVLSFPPEEYVIQGLMKPEPPRRPRNKKNGGSLGGINRRLALKLNSRAFRKPNNPLCEFCEFRDLVYGFCLLRRLGHACPYLNGNSNIVLVNRKNGEKRKAAIRPL